LVHELAAAVERQLVASKHDFVIPWTITEFNYDSWQAALRAWLIWRVQSETGVNTKSEMVKLLNISRPTLNSWERDSQVAAVLSKFRSIYERAERPESVTVGDTVARRGRI